MFRTTIMIPDELRNRLRVVAAQKGVSVATVVRDALEEHVAVTRPTPRSIGLGASGVADTARRSTDERPEPRAWR